MLNIIKNIIIIVDILSMFYILCAYDIAFDDKGMFLEKNDNVFYIGKIN